MSMKIDFQLGKVGNYSDAWPYYAERNYHYEFHMAPSSEAPMLPQICVPNDV